MNVKTINTEGLSHELEITVPTEEIESKLEARLKEIGKTASMRGFRKGRIPPKLLKNRIGKRVRGEVVQAAVFETYQVALHEKNVKAATRPEIDVKIAEAGKDLVYTISVESMPDLELSDFESIPLSKLVVSPDADDVDRKLQEIAGANPSTQPAAPGRGAEQGDTLTLNLQGRTTDDGSLHDSLQGEGQQLMLGSGQLMPTFEAQLLGAQVGDEIEVNIDFPETYDDADLAGRNAVIDVSILELHEPLAAEVDDELVSRLGFQDLDALRSAAEKELIGEWEAMIRSSMKRQLLDHLDATNQFEIPPKMMELVEVEFDGIIKQLEAQGASDGEQAQLTDSERQEYHEIAERRVRLGLIISEIGNSLKVVVKESDLQQALIAHARGFPGQEQEVVKYFSSNREALESLRPLALEEKVVNYLLGLAKITERPGTIGQLRRSLIEDDD